MATCLVCDGVELQALDASVSGEIAFYECPECHRQFAQKPGRALVERWLGPLSLVLYPVIFDLEPQNRVTAIRAPSGPRERENMERTVREIRRELDRPTQPVKQILDLRASEDDLREYLRRTAEAMERALGMR